MRFRPPPEGWDVPVLGLNESGSDMMLFTLVGGWEYDRGDSEALASYLESAADMVRRHA